VFPACLIPGRAQGELAFDDFGFDFVRVLAASRSSDSPFVFPPRQRNRESEKQWLVNVHIARSRIEAAAGVEAPIDIKAPF